jgi:hypothetical protein
MQGDETMWSEIEEMKESKEPEWKWTEGQPPNSANTKYNS